MKIETINEKFRAMCQGLLKRRWMALGAFVPDKITSLTDIEFMVGDEWGMTIEQIVPDEIPDDGTPQMDEIRRMAYSKPNVAKKLVSKDATMSWEMHIMLGYDLFHADKGMFKMYADNSEYWLKLKYSF